MSQKLLSIENLSVSLPLGSERLYAIKNISLALHSGETVCVVGESGSGKSLTAKAIMSLLPGPSVKVSNGKIIFGEEDLVHSNYERMRQIRGSEISMIFQEPMTALNPVMSIGSQIDEIFRFHVSMTAAERREKALNLLNDVNLPDPNQIVNAYAHELSGGQRQRAMIAMALALNPKILIADEPTTALDVTTQAQILKLIKDMQSLYNTGVLFITHDFGVVADIADRVAVMQEGSIVEKGTVDEVLNNPTHNYTKDLISAVPSLKPRPARKKADGAVISVRGLSKTFGGGKTFFGLGKSSRVVHAVRKVSLELFQGETLGIVGESGSGKSTLARCIIKLMDFESGEVLLDGIDISNLGRSQMRPLRRKIQMVFQDPFASLNPRIKVGNIISQGPLIQGSTKEQADNRARELLSVVGLDDRAFERYPHEFSGGQRQRIGVARALALNPEVLVADEPVSALDVSIQAQILKLLDNIRIKMNLSMIFITHDLRVAAQVCDRLIVMRYGEIVEVGSTAQMFTNPKHSYTKELLDAVPGKGWQKDNIDAADGKR